MKRKKSNKTKLKHEAKAKGIPLSSEAVDAIKHQVEAFKKKFGRDPGPKDPIFFDPSASTPEFMTSQQMDEVQSDLSEIASAANIDPALIYAMRKTGRIVTTENKKYLTPEAWREWNDAIDEYYEKLESGGEQ